MADSQATTADSTAAADWERAAEERRRTLQDGRRKVKEYLELYADEVVRSLHVTRAHLIAQQQQRRQQQEQPQQSQQHPPSSPPPTHPPPPAELPPPVQKLLRRFHFPPRSPSLQRLEKFTQTLRVMSEMKRALTDNIVVTKRDIFYHDTALFGSQSTVDRIVDELADILGVLKRSHTGVVAASKGLFGGGHIRVELFLPFASGAEVEAISGSHVRETLIPDVDTIQRITTTSGDGNDDAPSDPSVKWLLIVEKEAVFKKLMQYQVTRRLQRQGVGHGVLVTGKGYPDLLTKEFVVAFARDCPGIPLFALVDADPFGLHIFQQYQIALATAHPGRLTLLGVLQSDLDRYGVAEASLIPLESVDRKRARSMLNNLTLAEDEDGVIRHELERMLARGTKAEIECLSSIGRQEGTSNDGPVDGLVSYLQVKLQEALLSIQEPL